MKYEMEDARWDSIKGYLGKVWESPGKYPDKALLLSLNEKEMSQIFTKKRLELIRAVQSRKPKNATELSKKVNRKLSAVLRDLELLEKFRIVELEKKGKNIVPKITQKVLVIPLVKIEAKELAAITAR